MARKVLTVLTCDLHDKEVEAVESIEFAVRGVSYEIDVCGAHAKKLDEALGPFTSAARESASRPRPAAAARRGSAAKPGRQRPARSRDGAVRGRDDVAKIREWARAHGHTVADRGRIPASVVEQYRAANEG